MTEQYKIDTVAIILAEMLKESREEDITKGEFHKLPNNYAERIVKLFAIPVVSKRYLEKDMDNAYYKGYSDGAQAAATDILG